MRIPPRPAHLCAIAALGLVAGCAKLAPFRGDPPPGPLHPTFVADERAVTPPRRSRAELDAVLGAAPAPPRFPDPFKILLVAGPKDHGPGEHDHPRWQRAWAALLVTAPEVSVRTVSEWPRPDELAWADVLVLYSSNAGWSAARAAALDEHLQRGKGAVFLHGAVAGGKASERLAAQLGWALKPKSLKSRSGKVDLTFAGAGAHPITRGFVGLSMEDEIHTRLEGDERAVDLLASAVEAGAPRPILWTNRRGPGRIFVSLLGHYSATFNDPLFRVLVLRAIAWAGHQHSERLTALARVGVVIDE